MKLIVCSLTAYLVGSAAPVAAAPASGDPVPIVGSFDLSGANAANGKDALEGTQYAIAIVNQNGGVLGRPISLEYQDNGTNPQKAVTQSMALARGGAKFLMAPQSSANALAVSKIASPKLKLPTCSNSSNADDITIKYYQPYIFAMAASSYMEMRAVSSRLAKQPYKRYAVMSADYAGGRAGANRFKEFIKELNPHAEIVVEEYPKFGATDYTASINKVLAAKPDYVYTQLFGSDLLTFSKQAQAVGFFGQVKNRFFALYDGDTLEALGDYAATGTDGWQRAPANLFANGSAEAKTYVSGFKEKIGHYPSDWATLAYDCVSVWAQAANAAKTTDTDPVMAAIETLEFHSPRGPFRFGKYDHQAVVPTFIGKVAQDKAFGQPVLDITEIVSGPSVHPTEETVLKLRGGM